MGSFYRDLAGGEADGVAYPTLADGARGVAITDAALRSARSGHWEAVSPVADGDDLTRERRT